MLCNSDPDGFELRRQCWICVAPDPFDGVHAILVARTRVGAAIEQCHRGFAISTVHRHHQHGHAISVPRINIAPKLDQQPDSVNTPSPRSPRQWRAAVHGDAIDRSAVIQQEARAFGLAMEACMVQQLSAAVVN